MLSDAEIDPETDAVMVDGEVVPEAKIVTQQYLPLYPQASQVAPKQAGTNGGGIVGTNSAHPFENPNALTNLFAVSYTHLLQWFHSNYCSSLRWYRPQRWSRQCPCRHPPP